MSRIARSKARKLNLRLAHNIKATKRVSTTISDPTVSAQDARALGMLPRFMGCENKCHFSK